MVFSTLPFVYFFLPICLILYYAFKKQAARNIVLLAMSLLFYAWGEPTWIILMVATAFVNYICGKKIGSARNKTDKKFWLIASVAVSLGSLAVFKYTGFLIDNVNLIPFVNIPAWKLTLPIGISFYTFQSLSYTVDVYRGNTAVQKSYWNFLLYVCLFPQLIAGPIVRYADVAEEIENRRSTLQDFTKGATRFLTGLGKKLLLADRCAEYMVEYFESGSTVGSWIGLLMFTFQIYLDFSGYSDMAIGLGRMFGFHFKENFNYPYMCTSITDFWRRWHISLSSFFRDYVYIPLGGNRCSRGKHIRNILIVWGLTGFWHGANWNFIFWGLYFGGLLLIEKFVVGEKMDRVPTWARRIISLVLVMFGWALFYFEDLGQLGVFIGQLFGFAERFATADVWRLLGNNLLLIAVCVLVCMPIGQKLLAVNVNMRRKRGLPMHLAAAGTLTYDTVLLVLSTVMMVSSTYSPFLYFRF
ncbi:MAG: MBOAT family protein [Clostridia bacterium]|nr:MBOAT family protein [Clostridia bacterium]